MFERARESLLSVPFVLTVTAQGVWPTVTWQIRTNQGVHALRVVTKPEAGTEAILVAERLTPTALSELALDGVNCVDVLGNLHLSLGDQFAQVEGKTGPSKVRAMRAPAYRVLLAWLLDPTIISGPVRSTAAIANVSRTAVQDMRTRLTKWGFVVGAGTKLVWSVRGKREARQLWLEGWRTIRSQLDLGGFRLAGAGPNSSNLTHVRETLRRSRAESTVSWLWDGTEALKHIPSMKNYFVDFADAFPVIKLTINPTIEDVSSVLPLKPAEIYNVRIRALPFAAAANYGGPDGWPRSVPHPLLVWSELMCDSDPRVREAATKLEEDLPKGWL